MGIDSNLNVLIVTWACAYADPSPITHFSNFCAFTNMAYQDTEIFYGASVVRFIMKPQKAWSEGKLGLQWREMKLQTVENCSLENAASVNEGYPRLRGGILGNLLTLLLEIISYA